MTRTTLYFTGPRELEVRTEPMPDPAANEVLVRTERSAISAGTELLIYRGEAPPHMAADDALESLSGSLAYPLKYGYSAVGRVEAVGEDVGEQWLHRRVFAFQPHTSHFVSAPEALVPLPADMPPEEAALLPTMETAVNLVMDGAPILGERVCIFGQGVVGLFTTALLGAFPLERLVTVDRYARRRTLADEVGADAALDPDEDERLRELLRMDEPVNAEPCGADVVFELTGQPPVLNDALSIAGFGGRIIVGSWYGQKRAPLNLGARFHRERIQIISSQVSTIYPKYRGRWTKRRRIKTALQALSDIDSHRFITHDFEIHEASSAYELLDEEPENVVQIIITYDT